MKHIYTSIMKILVSIFILQFIITSANAQWSTDPTVNNVVCNTGGSQSSPVIATDGSGGAIISFVENVDIYAQRIDASGNYKWAARGVGICNDPQIQTYQQITSDGNGGAIITWQDYRSGIKYDIYAQKIDANGIVQWTSNGVAINTAGTTGFGSSYPHITTDGNGGAIIIWQDYRNNSTSGIDIYAQRIDASGAIQWASNGVAICTATSNQNDPQLCPDGANGAFIVWGDDRPAFNGDIYVQRIDANGVVQFTPDGVAIVTRSNWQRYPQICSDGSYGAIITWLDQYNGNDDVYVQRIASNGSALWTANGVPVCLATGLQRYPQISSDGSGGAIIAWYDYRNSAFNADIYAQRINAGATVQYPTDGVALCTATGHQYSPRIINDGSLGAIITWYDYRVSTLNPDIYAQRTDANGAVQWTADGVAICTNLATQTDPQIISDGFGGAIITWPDSRSGINNYDIYAQQVSKNGVLGNITTGLKEQSQGIHNLFLSQNYPNPFKQNTKIKYEIGSGQSVILKVSDLSGKEIRILVNGEQPAGTYEIDFDGSKTASGTYIIELKAGLLKVTKKMIQLK